MKINNTEVQPLTPKYIDRVLGKMLGAIQLRKAYEKLHKKCADKDDKNSDDEDDADEKNADNSEEKEDDQNANDSDVREKLEDDQGDDSLDKSLDSSNAVSRY